MKPSQERRRERHEAARGAKEAENAEDSSSSTLAAEAIVVEQIVEETENETAKEAIPSRTETKKTVAEQADPEHPCDLCDNKFWKFEWFKGPCWKTT